MTVRNKNIKSLPSELLKWGTSAHRVVWWELLRRLRESVTVSTPQGRMTLSLMSNDPIGRRLYCLREFELDLISATLSLLRRLGKCSVKGSGVLLDVGANNGIITVSMLHRGEFAAAISVEPEPRNFALLEHNVGQNGLASRTVCLPFAASDQEGSVEFELSATNMGDHRVRHHASEVSVVPELYAESARRTIRIQAEPLDSLLQRVPDPYDRDLALIWMDVQGFEGHVLAGAPELFARDVPLVCEIWPYGLTRAGTSGKDFCATCELFFSSYWVRRNGEFVERSVSELGALFSELSDDGSFENVVFVR